MTFRFTYLSSEKSIKICLATIFVFALGIDIFIHAKFDSNAEFNHSKEKTKTTAGNFSFQTGKLEKDRDM